MHDSNHLSRRAWLRAAAGGIGGGMISGCLPLFAQQEALVGSSPRACIVLWMTGGPSQIDTFDLKPGQSTGGTFKPIQSVVDGITLSQHLPRLAMRMNDLAVIRSMQTKEGDHLRASYLLHTGYSPTGPVEYPSLGSVVSHAIDDPSLDLPKYVMVNTEAVNFLANSGQNPGFLGPTHAPLVVSGPTARFPTTNTSLPVVPFQIENLDLPADISRQHFSSRLRILNAVEDDFQSTRGTDAVRGHRGAYSQAVRMILGQARDAFNLDRESNALRDAYGRSQFGQGCLLARRLVERGVRFVEVNLGGWDTHRDNFGTVQRLCGTLDSGWATLLADLKDRGLLASTLVLWMGEFGRTPRINQQGGRDHFPAAWSVVLGGSGIAGGQVVGKTTADGSDVADRPVSVGDLMATAIQAIGLDPRKQNMSNVGRPIRLADPNGKCLPELLT